MKTALNYWAGLFSVLKIPASTVLILLYVTSAVMAQSDQSTVYPLSSLQRREKVRQIYTSQLGVREKQVNSGPEVEQFLRYVKLPKGNPWCAAFVCWVYGEADVWNPRTGWSPDLFRNDKVIWTSGEPGTGKRDSRRPQNGIAEQRPRTADVFGIYFPEKGRIAHVGFVDEWNDPWLITVEGNTNLSGSREGDGVYRKRRLVRSIYKVARYIDN